MEIIWIVIYLIGITISYPLIKKMFIKSTGLRWTVFDRNFCIFLSLFWPLSLLIVYFFTVNNDKPSDW